MHLDQNRTPACLAEALSLLSAAFTPREKLELKETPSHFFHFTIGTAIRHEWSLWDDQSPLRIYFRQKGIHSADDASQIILEAFYRVLNNLPLAAEDLNRSHT